MSRFAHLACDWFPRGLPENVEVGPNVYIDSGWIFTGFFSRRSPALVLREGSGLYSHTSVYTGPDARITIGAYTCVNSATLVAHEAIDIGAHCLLSWGSVVTDALVPSNDLARRRRALTETAQDPVRRLRPMSDIRPVRIEDNVWIGFDSVVQGGVTIGRGAIVGCKTIVTEDVPPYAIVVGNPSRIVRFLDVDDTEEIRHAALRSFDLAPSEEQQYPCA